MQRLEEGSKGAAKPSLLNSGPSEETNGASILASLEHGKGGAASRSIPAKRRMRIAAYGATVGIAFVMAGWLFFDQSREPDAASTQGLGSSGLAVNSATSATSAPAPVDVIASAAAPSEEPQAETPATIVTEAALPQAADAASIVAGAAIASSLPQANAQRSLSASLEEGMTPQAPNASQAPETGLSKTPPRSPDAAQPKSREERKTDRKKERKSADDKRKIASASAKQKRERKAPVDGDVVLLSALVAHTSDPASTKTAAQKRAAADARARAANAAKRKQLAKAGNDASSHDIVERNYGDTTKELLQRCKKLGLLEGELCRLRICSGQWDSDAACRIQQP